MLKKNNLSTNIKTLVNIQKSIQSNEQLIPGAVSINEETIITPQQSGITFEINITDNDYNIYLPDQNTYMNVIPGLNYKFILGSTSGTNTVTIYQNDYKGYGMVISPYSDPQDGQLNFNSGSLIGNFTFSINAKPGDYFEIFCLTPTEWFFKGFSKYPNGLLRND